jgi:heat shock protein HslJ
MFTFQKKYFVYLLFCMVFLLAACAPVIGPQPGPTNTPGAAPPPSQTATPGAGEALAGTNWTLVSYGAPGAETPVIPGTTVTLEFGPGGQAGGSGGCNSYGAPYEVQGNVLSFGQLTSTLIACEGEGTGEQETLFFQALDNAGRFELAGDRLAIWYNAEQGRLNFVMSGTIPDTPVPETQTAETQTAGHPLCTSPELLQGTDWQLCRSRAFGFEIQFPPEGMLTDQTETTARIDLPFTPGTNLTEKYLEIAARQGFQPCSSPLAEGFAPGSIPTETVEINGVEFIKESAQEGAAGSIFEWAAYSTSRADLCFSLSFVLHSTNPEMEATPPPLFDKEAEMQVFEEIVRTFRWLDADIPPTATPTAAANPSPTSTPAQPTGEPTPTPVRINFEPGATSATVRGELEASGSALYVLRALEGQTMQVELSFDEGEAILAIWGEDGNVLLSDHAEASSFEGELPSTQDYFILLKGRPDGETEYRMEVTIPPA